jgi:hypothetical protein
MSEKPYVPEGDAAQSTPARRAWVPPTMTELPKLTELTLDSPINGGGGTGGGGSTVF